MGEMWHHLRDAVGQRDRHFAQSQPVLDRMIERGPLARRIVDRLPPEPSHDELHAVYNQLADCLATGTLFQ